LTLILEVNDQDFPNKGIIGDGRIMITPPIDENYWYFRVRLNDTGQAIVGFPKFSTIGIGFAQEREDWNCNLPFTCSPYTIFHHIAQNKGDEGIQEATCIEAIEMVRMAARRFKGLSDEEWEEAQARVTGG